MPSSLFPVHSKGNDICNGFHDQRDAGENPQINRSGKGIEENYHSAKFALGGYNQLFFRKLQIRLRSFMQNRNGVDDLGWAALILGFALYVLDAVLHTGVLAAAGMVAYGYSVFRLVINSLRPLYDIDMGNALFVAATYEGLTGVSSSENSLHSDGAYKKSSAVPRQMSVVHQRHNR